MVRVAGRLLARESDSDARRAQSLQNVVMDADNMYEIDPDCRVWLDPGGGITIKAVTAHGDPVELSTSEAQRLSDALLELVALEETA